MDLFAKIVYDRENQLQELVYPCSGLVTTKVMQAHFLGSFKVNWGLWLTKLKEFGDNTNSTNMMYNLLSLKYSHGFQISRDFKVS